MQRAANEATQQAVASDSDRHHRRVGRPLVALIVILVLLAAGALLWRTVVQPQDRFWQRIQESGIWQVAMDPSFPPFESLDEQGRPVGLDVELAQAIAQRWGVEVRIESVGFDGLLDAVWAGRVEGVISALPLQPQFAEDVTFSQPYFDAGLVLVLPLADSQTASVEDLLGQAQPRLAVEWGSEGDVQARQLRRRQPALQILPEETAQAALEAVVSGEADAALVDHVSALQFAGGGGQVQVSSQVLVSEPYVIATPRKAPILRKQVGEALEGLRADGTLQALTEKWLGRYSGE